MPKVKRTRRQKRGKRRVQPFRGIGPPPLRNPQVGGNFLFKLLGTVAKTLDALT